MIIIVNYFVLYTEKALIFEALQQILRLLKHSPEIFYRYIIKAYSIIIFIYQNASLYLSNPEYQ